MQQFSKNQRRYTQSIVLGALTGLGLVIVFASGFIFRGVIDLQSVNAASDANSYPLLSEVQGLIDEHYLRQQPDIKEREYGAIRGMLAILNDRYTFFVDPPVAQSESDVLAGTYGGIGVQVKRSEQGDLTLYPFADSPAQAAGIDSGDILLAINEVPVDINQQADTIDQMLRGEVKAESGVTLTFRHASTEEEKTAFIRFAVINVPSVVWRTVDDNPAIGYIQILIFTSRTPDELKNALTDLRQNNVSALVLDLRNNSGGLLQESVLVASQFIDGGVVVYEKSNQEEHELLAEQGGTGCRCYSGS
jgi:carboxyl-terminal processing protease